MQPDKGRNAEAADEMNWLIPMHNEVVYLDKREFCFSVSPGVRAQAPILKPRVKSNAAACAG